MKTAAQFVYDTMGARNYSADMADAVRERDAEWQARLDAAEAKQREGRCWPQCTKLVIAARAEGRMEGFASNVERCKHARADGKAEGLKEVAAKFPNHEPTGEDNDTVCAECYGSVTVDSQDEWSDGDVCFRCASSSLDDIEAFVNHQLAIIGKASKPVDSPPPAKEG